MDIQEIKLFEGYETDSHVIERPSRPEPPKRLHPACFFIMIALVSVAVSFLIIYLLNDK